MELSYTDIRSVKAKITCERNLDRHSLQAVCILKQTMDKENKYLIYKLITQFYIFKSSAPMAQLASDMDQDGSEHPL